MNRQGRNDIRISPRAQEERFYPLFVQISSPWDSQQHVLAECPEHFNSGAGWIVNHRRDIVMVHQMLQPLEWEFAADGSSAGYHHAFADGMVVDVRLRVEGNVVHQAIEFTNGSPTAARMLEPCFCVRLDPLTEFTTPDDKMDHLRRTVILIGGKPVSLADVRKGVAPSHQRANPKRFWAGCTVKGARREPEYWWFSRRHVADHGFIATESPQGGRWIACTWNSTRNLFTNIQCPCIHAQPDLPDCPPLRTVRDEGKIVFFEGTLDALIASLNLTET